MKIKNKQTKITPSLRRRFVFFKPEIMSSNMVISCLFFLFSFSFRGFQIIGASHSDTFSFKFLECPYGGFAPLSLSLSISRSRSRSFFSCPWPTLPAFSKRTILWRLEFLWAVFCVIFKYFPNFRVPDTFESWNFQDVCFSRAHNCWNF